jgi:DNA polymerase V
MTQLIKHPQATFMLRVSGQSMRDASILHGSVVLVDRVIKSESGHIAVALVDGEFTCKRLDLQGGFRPLPKNSAYPAIAPCDGQNVDVWWGAVATILICK